MILENMTFFRGIFIEINKNYIHDSRERGIRSTIEKKGKEKKKKKRHGCHFENIIWD